MAMMFFRSRSAGRAQNGNVGTPWAGGVRTIHEVRAGHDLSRLVLEEERTPVSIITKPPNRKAERTNVGYPRKRQVVQVLRLGLTPPDLFLHSRDVLLPPLDELPQQQPRARRPLLLVHDVVVAVRDEADLGEEPRLLDSEQVPRVLDHVRRLGDLAHVRQASADEVDDFLERLGGRARTLGILAHPHDCGKRVFPREVIHGDDLQPREADEKYYR